MGMKETIDYVDDQWNKVAGKKKKAKGSGPVHL